jgi:predicted aspartyl protease
MKHIRLLIILLLLPVFLHSQTNRDSIKTVIETLEGGLTNKDQSLVQKTFADNISISTGMGASANDLLSVILQNIHFESVKLLPDTLYSEKGITYAKVTFVIKPDKSQESIVAFNSENKILFIDYFDRLFGQSRYRKPSLVAVIPFTQDDKSIILSLRLNNNDRPLSFLLDTGADGMAIRKSLADSLGIKPDYEQRTNIVGGHTQVNISTGNTVHLTDSLSLTGQNMAIFDKIRHNLDGIIGMNLIKKYITKIDFDSQNISLYSFGAYDYSDNGTLIPIKMRRSLVVIPSELNLTGKEQLAANFLFDMGANYKLIVFSDFVQKNQLLQTGFQAESMGTTVSLGHSTPVYNGKAYELSVGDIISNNIPVTLQVSGLNDRPQNNGIDGSIGVQFWSEYNLIIDLLRKEIYLTPRKQPCLP